jgi:hypothetical protein
MLWVISTNPDRYDLKRIGRGEGIVDLPGLKLFGDIDPADLVQGGVGNCWVILPRTHSNTRALTLMHHAHAHVRTTNTRTHGHAAWESSCVQIATRHCHSVRGCARCTCVHVIASALRPRVCIAHGRGSAFAVQLISAMAALAEFDAEVEKLFVYATR